MTILSALALASALLAPAASPAGQPKIRVLLVTGGHDFEREPFLQMFGGDPELTLRHVEHPNAHAEFRPDPSRAYDVIVLYDMPQEISEDAKADLLRLVRQGKGLLALHHCLGAYPQWPEYQKLTGGRFWLAPHTVAGETRPGSTYEHGVTMRVHVANRTHPVTRGVDDFEIVDEVYGGFDVEPGVKPLLTTATPGSGPTIGWEHTYGRGRVVYLELGHDHTAYQNPAYRKLVTQAIRWVARRPSSPSAPGKGVEQ